MVDADKKVFWSMINITMELCNRPALSKEAIVGYWQSLSKYDLDTVRTALDTWVDSSSKAPTPHDLKELCKPKEEIYKALPRPNSREANKIQAQKVIRLIENSVKKQSRDWVKYWTDILDNPKQHKEITLIGARQALVNLGHKRV